MPGVCAVYHRISNNSYKINNFSCTNRLEDINILRNGVYEDLYEVVKKNACKSNMSKGRSTTVYRYLFINVFSRTSGRQKRHLTVLAFLLYEQ